MNRLPQGSNVPPPTRLDFRSHPVRFSSHKAPAPLPLCVLNSAFSIGSFSLAFKRAKIAFILNFSTLWSPLMTNVSHPPYSQNLKLYFQFSFYWDLASVRIMPVKCLSCSSSVALQYHIQRVLCSFHFTQLLCSVSVFWSHLPRVILSSSCSHESYLFFTMAIPQPWQRGVVKHQLSLALGVARAPGPAGYRAQLP